MRLHNGRRAHASRPANSPLADSADPATRAVVCTMTTEDGTENEEDRKAGAAERAVCN